MVPPANSLLLPLLVFRIDDAVTLVSYTKLERLNTVIWHFLEEKPASSQFWRNAVFEECSRSILI